MEEYKEHYTNLDTLKDKLNNDGVAVIKDVLNQQELNLARERYVANITSLNTTFRKTNK